MLAEFERITERGGVLGAMETGYQRGRIQDESMLYEHRKHDGIAADRRRQHVPRPDGDGERRRTIELARGDEAEKQSQLDRLRRLPRAPRRRARRRPWRRLQDVALGGGNLFDGLMDAVRVLLARPDHPGVLRGRRPVPAASIAPGSAPACRSTRSPRRAATGSAHGWARRRAGMAAVTSLMRVHQILSARVDEVLRPLDLTFARYEMLMLLSSAGAALPMARIGARLQVHPTTVTNAVDRLEAPGPGAPAAAPHRPARRRWRS